MYLWAINSVSLEWAPLSETGLCVAILALAVHSYFTQRLDRIITDMEMCFFALETMPVKAGQ